MDLTKHGHEKACLEFNFSRLDITVVIKMTSRRALLAPRFVTGGVVGGQSGTEERQHETVERGLANVLCA